MPKPYPKEFREGALALVRDGRPAAQVARELGENPMFYGVPVLTLWDGLRAVRLKLWDEERGQLVPFRTVRAVTFGLTATSGW